MIHQCQTRIQGVQIKSRRNNVLRFQYLVIGILNATGRTIGIRFASAALFCECQRAVCFTRHQAGMRINRYAHRGEKKKRRCDQVEDMVPSGFHIIKINSSGEFCLLLLNLMSTTQKKQSYY